MRPRRLKLYALLFAVDLACILGGFAVGAMLRFGEVLVDIWPGVTGSVIALFTLTAVASGAYSVDVLRSPSKGTARATGSLLLAFALLFLLLYFLKVDSRFSRLMTGSSLLLSCVSLALVRQILGDRMRRVQRGNFTTEILLVDGLKAHSPPGVLVFDTAALQLRPDLSDPVMQFRLAGLVQGADRVVVSCSRRAAVSWAQMLKCTGIRGEVLANDYDFLGPIGVAELDGHTTLVVSAGPLNVRQRLAKRAFDLALTVPLLLILLPVIVVIALAIKIDSRGPVLFKQPRVGFGNTMFNIYKFRTMVASRLDLHGDVSTSRDDGRLTPLGRLLRRTSLDELPQLINVVLGSMSIVGPRPHALGSRAGGKLFWDVDHRYWERHVLKPGITGLAQVRGFRGATRTSDHLTSRLRADLEYVSGWSLWRDVSILIRTLRVLTHAEAY